MCPLVNTEKNANYVQLTQISQVFLDSTVSVNNCTDSDIQKRKPVPKYHSCSRADKGSTITQASMLLKQNYVQACTPWAYASSLMPAMLQFKTF